MQSSPLYRVLSADLLAPASVEQPLHRATS
jgi:hypothetical protein